MSISKKGYLTTLRKTSTEKYILCPTYICLLICANAVLGSLAFVVQGRKVTISQITLEHIQRKLQN